MNSSSRRRKLAGKPVTKSNLSLRPGLRVRERYEDWDRGPVTGQSRDYISVYDVTAAPAG